MSKLIYPVPFIEDDDDIQESPSSHQSLFTPRPLSSFMPYRRARKLQYPPLEVARRSPPLESQQRSVDDVFGDAFPDPLNILSTPPNAPSTKPHRCPLAPVKRHLQTRRTLLTKSPIYHASVFCTGCDSEYLCMNWAPTVMTLEHFETFERDLNLHRCVVEFTDPNRPDIPMCEVHSKIESVLKVNTAGCTTQFSSLGFETRLSNIKSVTVCDTCPPSTILTVYEAIAHDSFCDCIIVRSKKK